MFKHLAQPVRRFSFTYIATARMTTAVFGASGRQYMRGEVLHKNEHGHSTVFKATYVSSPIPSSHSFGTLLTASQARK